eukprot:m51a1_g1306 hypothetical protein (194) ;mRNA; r:207183-208020
MSLAAPTAPLASSRSPRANIIDRPLPRARTDVSLSAFSFLFAEIVQYHSQSKASGGSDFQQRMQDLGYGVGVRTLELLVFRSGRFQRFTDLVEILRFISTVVWKTLFGKEAESLEQATGTKDTYWISYDSVVVNRFVPREQAANCASYVVGIVQGIMDTAEFPVKVSSIRYGGQKAGEESKTYIRVKVNDDNE